MRFHLPKPLHGWRAFAGEVGIIVLGVLIALGGGQLAEKVHERNLAADARQNVREEAASNIGFIADRLSVQACIDRRMGEIQAILAQSGEGPIAPQPTWVSRPPVWPFFTGRWQAATASGRNSLFAPQEQARFSILYRVFAQYDEDQGREQAVWSQLRALEWWRGPLGPQARLAFVQALQQAKYLAWELHYAGANVRSLGVEMGLPNRPVRPELHAICLPIDEPRSAALQRLKDPFGEP